MVMGSSRRTCLSWRPSWLLFRETVVAEKYEAMVKLGMANSRMKDFHDPRILAARGASC
jgi:hypothetical protein